MDGSEDSAGASGRFPDVSDKLNAPKKISQFEKARQEAEQKRQREEQEAQRALQEFEDSFAEGDDDGVYRDNSEGAYGSKAAGRPNGRSRFDQPYGSQAGPPPSLKRKRELEQLAEDRRRSGRDDYTPSRGHNRTGPGAKQVRLYDDDDDDFANAFGRRSPEPTVRKPTMLLQLLPLTTTERDIRSMMPPSLKIEDIHFLSSSRTQPDGDRHRSALVSASASTPISDVDKAIGQMQNKYLGFGCYLKISRHVSSSGRLSNVETSVLAMTSKNPFGATQQSYQDPGRPSYRETAPPSSLSRMPPPSNFGPSGPGPQKRTPVALSVSVSTPSDIKLLKLIHNTAEHLIQYGADFEALLMAQPEVQKDEKWAWLYDSTSQAGVYYRWLIWSHLSGDGDKPADQANIYDAGPIWSCPSEIPKYQSVTCLEDICDDKDYYSSDEDGIDEDTKKRALPPGSGGPVMNIDDVGNTAFDSQTNYLNPARRAKLTHLLARVPDNIATLRSGDVARVTHFVIHNAGSGADEITDMLVSNLEHPFRYAVKYGPATPSDPAQQPPDCSTAQLIALYLISDVLLTSSTSGVRDAWKYRNLFEAALLGRGALARLGRLERDLAWGRLKAEQWKRKVGVILDLWAAASVFTTDTWRALESQFLEPPLTAAERESQAQEEEKETGDREGGMWKAPPAEEGKRDGADEARAEALRKVERVREKMAALKRGDAAPEEKQPQQQQKRSRPTAAELNDAPAEPKLATAGGFGFALGGGAAKVGGGIGFSLGGAAVKQSAPEQKKVETGVVFGSDSE